MRFVSCGAATPCFPDPCSVPGGVWVAGDPSCPSSGRHSTSTTAGLSMCSPGRGGAYPGALEPEGVHSVRAAASVHHRHALDHGRSRFGGEGIAADARLSRSLRGWLAGGATLAVAVCRSRAAACGGRPRPALSLYGKSHDGPRQRHAQGPRTGQRTECSVVTGRDLLTIC
jgi:hypothetical protein